MTGELGSARLVASIYWQLFRRKQETLPASMARKVMMAAPHFRGRNRCDQNSKLMPCANGNAWL